LLKELRAKSKAERNTVGKAIDSACDAWGNPHLHAGIGIRKLVENFYECRSGLKTRLVFERLEEGELYFHLMGSHDEIRRFIGWRR
jgi:hypothetical protein